jgi:hypothetical protein
MNAAVSGFGFLVGLLAMHASAHAATSQFVFQLEDPSAIDQVRSTLDTRLGAAAQASVRPFATLTHWFHGTVESFAAPEFERALRSIAGVSSVEENSPVSGASALREERQDGSIDTVVPPPNDPGVSQQWALNALGMSQVWGMNLTRATRTRIAVLSSGISWTHRDLVGNIYANSGEAGDASFNGIDDDGNGLIDDYRGWNFAANNADTLDRLGRGTQIAGVIGAVGNNGVGMAGLLWRASILPVKVLDDRGQGLLSSALEGIAYAVQQGARVILLDVSLSRRSAVLDEAISAAVASGAVVIVPAGDQRADLDATPVYPAASALSGMATVAATNRAGQLAAGSNFGATAVPLAAPGYEIYSTNAQGGYGTYSSTALAAAHVAALSALLLESNPDWTPAAVVERLRLTSQPGCTMSGLVQSAGAISALNAVRDTRPAPMSGTWEWVDQRVESQHPYGNSISESYTVDVPGARCIRVLFSKIETEAGYDKIKLYRGTEGGTPFEELEGNKTDHLTGAIDGGRVAIRFTTDSSVVFFGFAIERVQVIR